MAGDWTPMRTNLREDPATIGIASLDGVADEMHAVGMLHRFWSWVQDYTPDGSRLSVTTSWIDDHIGVTGFAAMLEKHGWLERIGDDAIAIPGFDEWMSKGAKARLQAQKRQKRSREKRRDSVTHPSRIGVTKTSPEKSTVREEDTKKKKSTSSAVPASKPPKTRKPNPIWDAVCEAFGLKPVTRTDEKRIGRIVRDLKLKEASPDDIKVRLGRYRAEWPETADTPEALVKHWDRFGADKPKPNSLPHDGGKTHAQVAREYVSGGKPE